jgi:hypothetical protein
VRRALAATLALGVLAALPAIAGTATPAGARVPPPEVRFSTFNASLNRNAESQIATDLATPGNAQADAVAEIVQRVRPDVLLINEFDYVTADPMGPVDDLRDNYLEVAHGPPEDRTEPIEYPFAYIAPSNTGVPSGLDLNNDGTVGGPNDALGFGFFPGQFGMLVLSQYPIVTEDVRTFRDFRWADMPGARLPDDPATPAAADFYSAEELAVLPLSSKSHWDVPIDIDGRIVHFLVSHPTPPAFDGPERRNKLRNADEIRFWADYIAPGRRSAYIYDDEGVTGGLPMGTPFVIAGDQNSDPLDGDSESGAIQQLLDHNRIDASLPPESAGAVEASALQGGINFTHESDPRFDTADFNDNPAPGNLRVDYVLPSTQLRPIGGGVFWPVQADPLSRLTGTFPFPSSDHRAVWLDVVVRPGTR